MRAPAVQGWPPPRPESHSSRRRTLLVIAAEAAYPGRAQAAVRPALAEREARVRHAAAAQLLRQELRERRAVLEAVARPAPHDPDGLVLGVWRRDEVGVGGQAVVAARARGERLVAEHGEALLQELARAALALRGRRARPGVGVELRPVEVRAHLEAVAVERAQA